jgi:hypothetical protein
MKLKKRCTIFPWALMALHLLPVRTSQARAKFKHTAFIALNCDVLLPTFYTPSQEEGDIEAQYWRSFRPVGTDGTD